MSRRVSDLDSIEGLTVADSPATAVLIEILKRAGLQAADGRPLYRYAVDETRFAALKAQLRLLHRQQRLAHPSPGNAAVFALYVAEWFRREYEGGHYRWDSPFPEVIGELAASTIKSLARQGLAWWGLVPRRMAGGEMRLLSLVLEGGFPTRLLERERGRIAVHLRTLIARLEARTEVDEEAATMLSRTAGSTLGSYDHDEFHILCAELAQAVIALKRQAAAAAPPGISTSAWLDRSQPGWREALPIGLAGDLARRLLDELIGGRPERIGGAAGCQRLLVRDGERWVAALALEMQGEIDLPMALALPSEGRLHVFAAAALASVHAGELSLLDPPTELGQRWLSRRRGTPRAPAKFPFDQAAKVELRSVEDRRLVLTWPRGEPLRSELLVFADLHGDEADPSPKTLIHLGGGSLSTRQRRVWLLTPPDFIVFPLNSGDRMLPVWQGERHLYEARRSVHAGPPGQRGYRVEVGAGSDQVHALALDGPVLKGAEAVRGDVTIFAGVPRLRLHSDLQNRAPQDGQVAWRPSGPSIWRDWDSEPPDAERDQGPLEVVWLDPKSRTPLDRQRFVLMPPGAEISARPSGERGVVYSLDRLEGWTLEIASNEVTAMASPGGLEVVFVGRPVRRLALSLASTKTRLAVLARAPVAGGGFCSTDGVLLDNGARVMLDDLRGAVAFSPGHERLYLLGPHGSDSRLAFDDELALWAASEEIVRLLSASSGLDDVVTLELGRLGRRLKVGRYAATLTISPDGRVSLVPELPAGAALRLDWLSVTTGQHRVLSNGAWIERLPDDLEGPGILMPRQNGRVIGRPTLVPGGPLPTEGLGPLQRATLISRGGNRRAAMAERLETLADDSAEAAVDRGFLLRLINALDGAPPSAVDALAMLPGHPAALAGLAATADTDELVGKVWLLERELPFLWAATPLHLWMSAFATRRQTLERLLIAHGFDAVPAADLARSAVIEAADAIAGLDPMLRTALALVVGATPSTDAAPSLTDAVQDRLRRTAEDYESQGTVAFRSQDSTAAGSCFRRAGSALTERLPVFRFDESFREGLDAPCALALAAAAWPDDPHRIVLDAEQIRRARDARAREPQSFADIYGAALKLLARGVPLAL
ncbi:MAG TPA: STY4851/ECs_5259 family protein [Caulobacteraceae bacterium]|jgi:hypothetical protein|nr:STY4851/ECs_5259 family protein [Caulobacteraceae bacterium]